MKFYSLPDTWLSFQTGPDGEPKYPPIPRSELGRAKSIRGMRVKALEAGYKPVTIAEVLDDKIIYGASLMAVAMANRDQINYIITPLGNRINY